MAHNPMIETVDRTLMPRNGLADPDHAGRRAAAANPGGRRVPGCRVHWAIMLEPPPDLLIITAAALAGGMLNALAGGGSFLTLPALVLTGVPAVVANATGTAALLPGYLASAWSGREFLRAPAGLSMLAVIGLGAFGGVVGAALLLTTPNAVFSVIIPWLLLFATVVFALGPRIHAAMAARAGREGGWWGAMGLLGVSAYGGYFNGGMGIVMLAAFRLMGVHDIHAANALKNLLSGVLTLIAVVIYGLGGLVAWREMLPMAAAASLGGVAGVMLGRRIPPPLLRAGIVAVGAITTALFFRDA